MERIYITDDGEYLLISEMETDRIVSSMRALEKKAREGTMIYIEGDEVLERFNYKWLMEELNERLL